MRLFLLSLLRRGRLSNLATREAGDTAAERRSISASRNALAINVILKAAMASPPQIARASCTSSSIASAAVGEGFARAGSDTGIPYAFTGQLEGSSGASVIRHSTVTATRARRMQKDQLRAARTIPPSHSVRQASSRRPCCHKESAVASRLRDLAGREPVERQRRQLCVSKTSFSAPPIGAQLNQPTCRRPYDHACGACCLGSNQSTRT